MANGVVVQLAVLAGFAVILTCLLIVHKTRRTRRAPVFGVTSVQAAVARIEKIDKVEDQENIREGAVPTLTMRVATEAPPDPTPEAVEETTGPTVPVVCSAPAPPVPEDRNQRILAGISENIRKSLIKPVPTYSPIDYPEKPRDTEYVRVKKQIITPHGQVRFSILKDSLSANMLAVFRRASLDWQTAADLIGFLPSYLEPEAEILGSSVLLVGTPGHNEKLAIPIRALDPDSSLRDCFDFISDVRTETNVPAVLLVTDTNLELVSRGVITQPVFISRVERERAEVVVVARDSDDVKRIGRGTEVKLLVE